MRKCELSENKLAVVGGNDVNPQSRSDEKCSLVNIWTNTKLQNSITLQNCKDLMGLLRKWCDTNWIHKFLFLFTQLSVAIKMWPSGWMIVKTTRLVSHFNFVLVISP